MFRAGEVPRIADEFTDIAVYLYQSQEHALAGSESGGSGFLVGVPVDGMPGKSWQIVVTNRHVIEKGYTFVRVNNKAGHTSVFEIIEPHWIFHPDEQDIAIGPAPVDENLHRYRFLHKSALLTREKIQELDIGLGTDTLMVGRFVHRDGGQTNAPTVRFGHIAQMPTFIKNENGKLQESFLIETRSIGGYSGSPVLAYKPPFQSKLGGEVGGETKYWGPALLGIDWGHSGQVEFVFDASGRELQMYVESNTGLSLVIPAWRLIELLECDTLKQRLAVSGGDLGVVDLTLPPNLKPGWTG